MLLVCTDGLHGPLEDSQILDILTKGTPLEECALELIKAAEEAGATDNVSAVLIRFAETPRTNRAEQVSAMEV
jgi:protein phosphatase